MPSISLAQTVVVRCVSSPSFSADWCLPEKTTVCVQACGHRLTRPFRQHPNGTRFVKDSFKHCSDADLKSATLPAKAQQPQLLSPWPPCLPSSWNKKFDSQPGHTHNTLSSSETTDVSGCKFSERSTWRDDCCMREIPSNSQERSCSDGLLASRGEPRGILAVADTHVHVGMPASISQVNPLQS